MYEITGQYNSAKLFIDSIDANTLAQIYAMLNTESLAGSNIAIMPDCHAGEGCVIGTTMTVTDSVIPNLVGVDIGCGMLAVRLDETEIDLPLFDKIVQEHVPSGPDVHVELVAYNKELENMYCNKQAIRTALAQHSLGTLGGGNHFIEIDRDNHGHLWLVVHTGSRHLGIEVCNFYQKAAYDALVQEHYRTVIEPEKQAAIKNLTNASRKPEIPAALNKIKKKYENWTPSVPKDKSACTGDLMHRYLNDMGIAQRHAMLNRMTIVEQLLKYTGLHGVEIFDTIHNYIDLETNILRKGAVSAQKDQRLLIPLNMRDGSLICTGKGNPDWNFSAPHGAGRVLSRADAKANITMDEYQQAMSGIYTTSVNPSTLDESPMAYKPAELIKAAIQDTVEITAELKPIYNFKA